MDKNQRLPSDLENITEKCGENIDSIKMIGKMRISCNKKSLEKFRKYSR